MLKDIYIYIYIMEWGGGRKGQPKGAILFGGEMRCYLKSKEKYSLSITFKVVTSEEKE